MENAFWSFQEPFNSRGLNWAEYLGGPIEECPAGHRLSRRVKDLIVEINGKRLPDIAWAGPGECIIQDHVLQMFQKEGFTGFEVRPVHARRRSRGKSTDTSPLPKLWELVITGWGGIGTPESGVQLLEKCECSFMKYKVFDDPLKLIDESQWDGSDFFMVWPMPLYKFVTDRVAQFIRSNKLKGVELVALADMKGWGTTSIAGLRYFMPEGRAREIGEPLGIY